jgi:Fic family protein
LLTDKEKLELAKLNDQYIKNKNTLTSTLLQKELERLIIEFSWKSSQIEANTYSLLDAERLLKENVQAKGKKTEETNT